MAMRMLKCLRIKMILGSRLKDLNKSQPWHQHSSDLQINKIYNNNNSNRNNCIKIMLQLFDKKRIAIDQQFEEAHKSKEIKGHLSWVWKNQIILVKKAALPQGCNNLLVLLRRIVLLPKIKLVYLLGEDLDMTFLLLCYVW